MNQIIETLRNDEPAMVFLRSTADSHKEEIDAREVGESYYKLGKIYYDKADLDVAQSYFLKTLKVVEHPRDNFFMLKTLGFLIRIASEKLEDDTAKLYIQQTEELLNELTTSLGSLNAEYFYNLGTLHTYRGNFKEAKDSFNLAYKKSKEENEAELLAKGLLALANNSFAQKDYDTALQHLNQLDELLRIIKKAYIAGSMHFLDAKIHMELGLYERALSSLQKASAHLQDKKCWNLRGYILLGRGSIYQSMGDFTKSLLFFEMALEVVDNNLFKRLVNLVHNEIQEVNDSSVDIYLDRANRKIRERNLGIIDFKHRFILLEILFLLAKNPGTYYNKEDLAKLIWKDEYNPLIHDKLIYTSVSRLRKLIEPDEKDETRRKYILRGKDGYTFNPMAKIRFHMENKIASVKSIANVELTSPV